MRNKKNVPDIRFREFSCDWKSRRFDKTFSILSNNTLSRAELNYENGSTKNIHYGDILIKFGECTNVAHEDIPYISDEKIAVKYWASRLQEGDIVFADTAEDTTAGKCTECFNIKEQPIISGLHTIPCHPLFPFSTGYLGYYLNSPAYHNQLLPLMQGTKVVGISKTAMRDTNISFPDDTNEQKSISNYFQNIDRLINTSQTKLDKLKNIKKACLDKMFPQKSSNTPRLRFKGFTEEWKEIKVKNIGKVITGSTPSKNDSMFWDGDFIWVTAQDLKNKYINNSIFKLTISGKGKARVIPKNSIIITCIASIGLNGINNVECATNQQINSIVCNTEYYYEYIYYAFEYRANLLRGIAGQTAIPIINKSIFEEFLIISPKDKIEQEKIGNIFKNLDDLIDKTEQRIDKLKNIKKACLNKMFVNMEDRI